MFFFRRVTKLVNWLRFLIEGSKEKLSSFGVFFIIHIFKLFKVFAADPYTHDYPAWFSFSFKNHAEFSPPCNQFPIPDEEFLR